MTADDVIKIASTFSTWVATHVVAIGAAVTATLPVLSILGWIHLTVDELAGLQLGIAGIVAAVTGKGTVSKPRVGERIEEKVAQQVTAITGTGDGTPAGAVMTVNKER